MKPNDRNREIAHHIFTGSITMVGVCITVITLFRVMKTSMQTYADEILAIDTFVFIAAALFSYAALRKENNHRLERLADILFFGGMLVMPVVGIIIIYSTY